MLTFMAGRKAFQGFEGMADAQRRRLGAEVGTGGAGAGAGVGGDLWEFPVAPGSTHKLLKRTGFECALVAFHRSESQPQARGMDSIHLFLSLSHTHSLRHIAISSCVYVMGTVSI